MIDTTLYSQMKFKYPWRKYQGMILDKFSDENGLTQNKLHLVAPPGSGKTIVGLELIRRSNRPAVIFSPTSTIQVQWKDKVSLFTKESEKKLVKDIASKDPHNLRLINTLTYQLVSSPSENKDFIVELAEKEWSEALIKENVVSDEELALPRIKELKKRNRKQYDKNLSKYYKKSKDKLLDDPNFATKEILHPNAIKLIEELVDIGVKTVVLDESHHLLDYWAAVLKVLLKEIGDYNIIGLTATPPLDANKNEIENYYSLLGDIDFEVPTPAVVKEGNLAPYQDLVYMVKPTKRERNYIKNIQDHFEEALTEITASGSYHEWLSNTNWAAQMDDNAPFALAGMKYFHNFDIEPPKDLIFFEEAYKDMYIEDWMLLLSEYALNFLVVSEDTVLQKEFTKIKKLLKDFGFTLTERGVRSHRSPADRVLSLSEAKSEATVKILTEEMKSIGTDIRAVVITDFENESAYSKRYLKDVIDTKSGGAVFAYHSIVHDQITTKLEAILVTGKRVLIDADEEKVIVTAMKEWRDEVGLSFKLEVKETEFERILEVVGSGKDWKSQTYVLMVTALFEKGVTRCLVGTRGLLAEGWDTLSLNTLIDLTTATTSTMVQQIRGRSLRINPNDPQMVSNNWDVVCIEPNFEKGDQDLLRLIKKHNRFYGLGSGGKIVKGIAHLDEAMFFELFTQGFKKLQLNLINDRMLAKSKQRDKIYEEWDIGSGYLNMDLYTTQLQPKDIKFKTVGTLRNSLKAILYNLLFSTTSAIATGFYLVVNFRVLEIPSVLSIFICMFVFMIIIFIYTARNIYKYFVAAFIELPIDSYVNDMAKTVLSALRETELVDRKLSVDDLRVKYDENGYIEVFLDYANDEDTKTFSRAFNELFEPIIRQRYMVQRSEADMKLGIFTPFWYPLRKAYGMFLEQDKVSYHPVPAILSVNRKKADVFLEYWRDYVGGSKLVYTRSRKGLEILLKQRSKKYQKVRRVNLNLWK